MRCLWTGALGSPKCGMSNVPKTSAAPVINTTAIGSTATFVVGFASRLVRAKVLSIRNVAIPAPTAASVKATSGASSSSIQPAPKKL